MILISGASWCRMFSRFVFSFALRAVVTPTRAVGSVARRPALAMGEPPCAKDTGVGVKRAVFSCNLGRRIAIRPKGTLSRIVTQSRAPFDSTMVPILVLP